MSKKPKIAVIGSTGYSGAEIIRLLLKHGQINLNTLMTSNEERISSKSISISQALPHFINQCNLPIEPLNSSLLKERGIDLVFLATPNESSHRVIPELLRHNLQVIDLSGAFRLRDIDQYSKWYGFKHLFPSELELSVYGLTEINRLEIKNAQLLANPGCYPTSILLPLIPLHRANLIDYNSTIICDSKSGVSGAGKSPSTATHFSEVTENFNAYKVNQHQHSPEIWQELGNSKVIFTPHLLPINRGILSTIYVKLSDPVDAKDVSDCLNLNYSNESMVRLFKEGTLPQVKYVAHTNFCDIGWEIAGTHLIIVSAIDNLGKGAAGQAVQNMNVMLGLEETLGLI